MKSKLVRQKEEEPHDASALDIEQVLRERYQKDEAQTNFQNARKSGQPTATSQVLKPKIAVPKAIQPPRVVQTKTARVAGSGATGRKRNVIRVSVDFPVNLYETVVAASNEQEQTIREFILNLVRQRFNS